MKKLILIAGCVSLAACSQSDAPAEAEKEMMAPEAVAEDTLAGTYDATGADGVTSVTTIDAEGNYTVSVDGAEVESGTVVETASQTCFNSAEEGSAPECWTDGEPAEDGSWVATSDDGATMTVKKRAEAAAAE